MDHHSYSICFLKLSGILAFRRSKWSCLAAQQNEVLDVDWPDIETITSVSSKADLLYGIVGSREESLFPLLSALLLPAHDCPLNITKLFLSAGGTFPANRF